MKTKNSGELSEQQKSFVIKALNDSVLFANHILGVSLWAREVEILQSIRTQRRTAVKACHSIGKTFTLAIATLWWLARYPEGIVLTTSPTQRQVRTQLWSDLMVNPAHFQKCPDAGPTSLTARGWHSCSSTDCCAAVLYPQRRFASCATSPVIARPD
jgi:hypothetical protein